MLEGASIICFAKDWGGDLTSSNHIIRILSARNHILWINSIGLRRPALGRRDLKRLVLKFARGLRGCVRVGPNVHDFNPLVMPLPDSPPVVRLNKLLLSDDTSDIPAPWYAAADPVELSPERGGSRGHTR